MNTTTLNHAAAVPVSRTRLVLGIFKLRIAVLIMVTALGGMAIVPGGSLGLVQTVVLALSVLLASAAAGAFNQYA
jgi:heme o synthase